MGIFKPNNETGGKSGGWLNDALFGKDSKPRAQMEDGQYRQIVGMDTSTKSFMSTIQQPTRT